MRAGSFIAVLAFAAALAGCNRDEPTGARTGQRPPLPAENAAARVPLGDVAGAALLPSALADAENPFQGNGGAIDDGHRLYVDLNCAGCHGYKGAGGMGPDLTDGYWRYGGEPLSIYKSIFEGRPQGMPSWGRALPPQDIWKLVAFIESFQEPHGQPQTQDTGRSSGQAEGQGLGRR